jgi:hypothetical protein
MIDFMGWFDGLKLAAQVSQGNVVPFRRPKAVVSPWQDSSNLLPAIVVSDLWGEQVPMVVDRQLAMQIPAIVKGRALLHSIIGSRNLVQITDATGDKVENQPTWLYRSDTGVSPIQRNKAMLDDHIFCEATLLAVQRGSRDSILDAIHVPYSLWSLNEDNEILVNNDTVDEDDVIYIPAPGPGLLVQARRHIIAAINIDAAWQRRVQTPVPPILLQETEDNGMDPDEMKAWVSDVAAGRQGGVMGIPSKLTATFPGIEQTDLFESGRNALRLDWANLLNLPASLIEGSVATASLTYSTQAGKRNELFDYSIPYWASAIEQGLSLDSVVPRGTSIRFDFEDLLTETAKPEETPVDDTTPPATAAPQPTQAPAAPTTNEVTTP